MNNFNNKEEKDAKITIGYLCNNNCIFCMDRENKNLPQKSNEYLKKEITEAKNKGNKRINFLGGEITLRPDCINLVKFASKQGFESISITTNGRMFSYPEFARKIIDSGVSNIIFSLHGHNPEIHDSLTGVKGSFNQLYSGIMNLKREGFNQIGVNVVIINQNYKFLPNIAQELSNLSIERVEFIYCYNEKKFKYLIPKVSLAEKYIKEAIKIGKKNNFNWKLQNPPLPCFFEEMIANLSVAGENEKSNFLNSKEYEKAEEKKKIIRIKLPICKNCTYSAKCPGVWKRYGEHYGYKEVKPMKQKNPLFNDYWNFSEFLIHKFELNHRKNFIKEVTSKLFNGISYEVLEKNMKFDFSMSSKSEPFRFSFNDFEERKSSYAKYLEFFSNFPEHCNIPLVEKILNTMLPNEKHQTTIGAEIGKSPQEDRLKLYFEDFEYPEEEIRHRLDKVIFILGLEKEAIYHQIKNMKINALGVDFFYGKKIGFKVYTKHSNLDAFFEDKNIKEFQEKFPPKLDEFYLLAFRFNENSKIISKKVYKVYNIIKYREKIEGNMEIIFKYLDGKKEEKLLKKISDSITFLDKQKNILVPVLYSEDKELEKKEIYFSIGKKIK